MSKSFKKRKIDEIKKQNFYTVTDDFKNINKVIFPNTLQVGLNDDTFNSTISGSIHHTRQGKSYLVAGTNVTITSSSNGQVIIDASANEGAKGDTGASGQNAKSVNLTASSTVIQYDAAGSNPSPSSITLTATSQEFANGFFKFTGGGGSFSDEGSFTEGTAANSDTATFSVPSSYSSTPYDFRVGVAEGNQSEVVFDTVSVGSTRIGTTGDPGNDAVSKTVKLTASHTIIQYDAAGSNPSPSSITLTATSKNFTNGFFKFTGDSFSDEGSFTDGTTANSDTATFTAPTSFGSTPYTLRVGVAEGDQSEVDFDTISIGSTRIGTTGTSGNDIPGVTIILDPLSVLLIANSAGTVSDYTPSGATIKVYEGGTQLNLDTVSGMSNSTFKIISATGTNITAGAISQTNGQNTATIADASSITANTATIAHVIRVKNSAGTETDYTVTQTIAKAITGTSGTDGSSTPAVDFTLSVIPIPTNDGGGALADDNDLDDADISSQAFTKIDANDGTTNITFAGHYEDAYGSSNTYRIDSDNITAVTDNGTSLTVSNTASANGDTSYNITCTNIGTKLKFAVTSDSSDAKFRVSYLGKHENGGLDLGSTDFNSVNVTVPIRINTGAGNQIITRSFVVQKINKGTTGTNGTDGTDGTDGADGAVALAVFAIDSSADAVTLTQTGASTADFTTPYDTAVISNSNVVSSNNSGVLTLAGNGTYSVTVSMRVTEITAGDAGSSYKLTLALDQGVKSFTTLSNFDECTPGGNLKTDNLLISNAIISATAHSVSPPVAVRLLTQISKDTATTNVIRADQSTERLVTIRVEKLS